MDVPEVRFAMTSDDVRIAYQDYGEGQPVVLAPSFISQVEANWGHHLVRRFFEWMGQFIRLVVFDHRGAGMSDGFAGIPSLDDRILDIEAVLDSAGLEKTNLAGFEVGAAIAIGFAAAFPERVEKMSLINAMVGASGAERAAALNPEGHGMEQRPPESFRPPDDFGADARSHMMWFTPSAAKHPDFLDWLPKIQRTIASRDQYQRLMESARVIDITDIAPLVRAPTQLIHTVGNRAHHIGYARLLDELIPDSTLVEIDSVDANFWVSDNWREITDVAIAFVTGETPSTPVERKFLAVLITDLVASSQAALSVGDAEWRQRLDIHDRISRQIIATCHGTVVKHTGDGHLATFESPDDALSAAIKLRDSLTAIDMPIRAGLHFGQVEVRGTDIAGTVVNVAARVEQAADDGQIYTTTAIREMLIGTPFQFQTVGPTRLKGFDQEWILHRVDQQLATQ